MPIAISSRFDFTCDQPTDIILQFEAAAIPEQRVLSTDTRINCADIARVAAHDGIGERVLFEATGKIESEYISLADYDGLVRLLVEIGRRLDEPKLAPPLMDRLDDLFKHRRAVLAR